MGITETVPLGTCCTYELVCGSSNTLIIGEGGEVELLFHLLEPIIGYKRVRVGAIIGRWPQLQKSHQLPLEVILLTSLATVCSIYKSCKKLGLLRHHLYQVRWWWWQNVLLRRWGILQVEGYPSMSTATAMTTVVATMPPIWFDWFEGGRMSMVH